MERPDYDTEEAVLARLADAPLGSILTIVYLVGAYWPWWLVGLGVSLLAWRVTDHAFAWNVSVGFGAAAVLGYAVKLLMDRRYGP